MTSLFPFTGECGKTLLSTVRGNNLGGASAAFLDDESAPASPPFSVAIEGAEADTVKLRVQVASGAKPGRYLFRLITAKGVSNALPLYIVEQPVSPEPEGSHESPATAIEVPKLPAICSGRIDRRGETDYYAFDAKAGETLTFEAISGLPSTGAPGGNAVGFDPSLSLYEQSGSWFDSQRLNRIGFNDEPLWVIGKPTDARLVHHFEKAGHFLLRIEAFSGQGGPDYGYQLKMLTGDQPMDAPPAKEGWEERTFTRTLSTDRMNELAARGVKPKTDKSIETYRPGSKIKLPAMIEGGIVKPGEAQQASFHIDNPQDVAIEIQTPEDTTPLFNPIVRLLRAGDETATNVFVGRGACTGELTKAIQAKTTVPLRDTGDYTVEIRDTTPDIGSPRFRYRLLVRPQIPHVGDVKIQEDHINLSPGLARPVRVVFDREEGFEGAIGVSAEDLPAGISTLAGADFEPDKDPPQPNTKRERYVPRTERAVVVFMASSDASVIAKPQLVRLVVRPIVAGKPGSVIATKQIPVMVVAK